MELQEISREEAYEFLYRRRDCHLMHLGALGYDPLRAVIGVRAATGIVAVALIVLHAGALPDPRPTIMVAANDQAALLFLVQQYQWPTPAVWATGEIWLHDALEVLLPGRYTPTRGLVFYGAETADGSPVMLQLPLIRLDWIVVRELTQRDQDLDLQPCMLSPTSLRGWLQQGWHIFGAIQGRTLLAHALAAYPIGDADEVAAVYTAARARRSGLASLVSAAVVEYARQHDRRAFYVTSRVNLPSQRVAEGLGLRRIGETRELVVE